jgi:hypothetical protein
MTAMQATDQRCVWGRDDVPLNMWTLADVITELRALQEDLTEDDGGEEEEEDEP